MSFLVRCHFLHFFSSGVDDTDELGCLSLSLDFFSSAAKNDDDKPRSRLIVVFDCFALVM